MLGQTLSDHRVQQQAQQTFDGHELAGMAVSHSHEPGTQGGKLNHRAVVESGTDRVVGMVQLSDAHHNEAMVKALGGKLHKDSQAIGYVIHPDSAGKGYATAAVKASVKEAFVQGNSQQLVATVDPSNAASKRILEKAGFKLKKSGVEDSEYGSGRSDVYVLSRKRWNKVNGGAGVSDGVDPASQTAVRENVPVVSTYVPGSAPSQGAPTYVPYSPRQP